MAAEGGHPGGMDGVVRAHLDEGFNRRDSSAKYHEGFSQAYSIEGRPRFSPDSG
jgi:hypothetical protein